ncbi:MAG: hypothetical protein ACKOCD_03320 [Nitrospiraceae bacterium]
MRDHRAYTRAHSGFVYAGSCLAAFVLSACVAVAPPNRLAVYVGPQAVGANPADVMLPTQRPRRAGLL